MEWEGRGGGGDRGESNIFTNTSFSALIVWEAIELAAVTGIEKMFMVVHDQQTTVHVVKNLTSSYLETDLLLWRSRLLNFNVNMTYKYAAIVIKNIKLSNLLNSIDIGL